jgi:molybdenum cofactor guanylyltransferase
VGLNAFTTASARTSRPARLPVIVLAGGRSERFGSDKLAARIRGRSALARVIARVAPLASDVTVATSSLARRRELSPLVPSSVRFLLDRRDRWGEGPAGAMARALTEVSSGPVLFVPGDLPWIETEALRRLVDLAEASAADVAVPWWLSGETEHLVQWQRSPANLRYLPVRRRALSPARRASEFLRALPRTLLVPVAALTRRPDTFAHLTFPSDVERPGARGVAGPRTLPEMIEGSPKRWYHVAHDSWGIGRIAQAAHAFAAESRWYRDADLPILARHARNDARQAAAGKRGVAARTDLRRRRLPFPGHDGRATVNRRGRLRRDR